MFFQKPFSMKQRGMELDYDKIIDFSVRKKKAYRVIISRNKECKEPLFWKAFARIALIIE